MRGTTRTILSSSTRRCLLATLTFLVVTAPAATAFAQSSAPDATATNAVPTSAAPPTDDRAAEARRQFEIGVEALRDERYPDALHAFRASYDIRRAASVALNLGITLRALGRLSEAREFLQEFLRDASPAQHAEHDGLVQNYLLDLNRRIGVLEIRLAADTPPDATLSLDGQRVVLDAHGAVAIDPGDHNVAVRAHGWHTERREVHVDPGGRVAVEIQMTRVTRAIDTQRVLAPSPAPPREAPPRSTSTVAIVVSVAAVVVAAAIIVPIAVVSSSGYNDPAMNSTGVVLQGP